MLAVSREGAKTSVASEQIRRRSESAAPTRAIAANPREEWTHPLAKLQAQAGNSAVVATLARAQRKLVVGAASDPAELEADAVASQVVASIDLRRLTADKCASSCGHPEVVSRSAAVGAAGGVVEGEVEQRLRAALGGGSALPGETRRQLEAGFGADFGRVRVHADETAAELARSVSARAFTVGAHIFLGKGQRAGDHQLMAHELTHTIQQGASRQRRQVRD